MHMSRMSTVLTEERGNDPFSRFRHKTAIDHQDIDSQESDLILTEILSQELVTSSGRERSQLKTCLKRGKSLVIAKMSSLNLLQYVTEHHCRTEVVNNHLSAAIQKPASDTSPL